MSTVQEIIHCLEALAPKRLAESWDNVGLMVGDVTQAVTGVLTTLDVTPEAVEMAIREKCNFIISHHPLFFKPIKALSLNTAQGTLIKTLVKHDIAVYSAHTNLDVAEGGLNDWLAKQIGLTDVRGLVTTSEDEICKVVVFVPRSHAEVVRLAMGQAGAGYIGNYSYCSFSSDGYGRFKPEVGANPFIGMVGELEVVEETKIETIVPRHRLESVLTAMQEAHPYEEVAFEVISLTTPKEVHQLGRMGRLPHVMKLDEFREYMKTSLPKGTIRLAGKEKGTIETVALCSGSGAEFIKVAAQQGADAYVTGDVKYHEAQLAKELGLLIVDGGHFGTEACVAEGLKDYLETAYKERLDFSIVPFNEQEDFFF